MRKISLGTKINLLLLSCLFTVIILISFAAYFLSYKMVIHSWANKADEIAAMSSASIDLEEFQSYKTKEDTEKASYKETAEKLAYIRKVSGAKYIYAIRKNDNGDYEYVLDGSEKPAAIGDIEKSFPSFDKVYQGKPIIDNKVDIDENGTTISAYYPLISGNKVIGFVGADYNVEQGYKDLSKLKLILIILALITFILTIIIGTIFSKKLTKPLIQISNVASKISNYDLRNHKLSIKNKDEIGILAATINMMSDNMVNLIKSIKLSVHTITENMNSLSSISSTASSSIENITIAINEIAVSTNKQTEETFHETNKINELTENILEVSKGIKSIEEISQDIESLNQTGMNTIKALTDKWKENTEASNKVEAVIEEVNKNSAEVQAIVETIGSIAKQTHLLALNASIEASRTGEAGRGFSVVAEEIKKLSEQSAKSTNSIKNLVASIQSTSKMAVQAMGNAKSSALEQSLIITDTEKIFLDFNSNINTLSKELQKIVAQNLLMNESKKEILSLVENIRSLAEENNMNVEETTATTEEFFGTISEFKDYVEQMNKLSQSLYNEVLKFNI